MVDAGLTLRRLEQRLVVIGAPPQSLHGVFITHAHRDHVASYLIKRPFATRHELHSYASTPTWHELLAAGCGALRPEDCHRFEAGETLSIGDLRVTALAKPHDAAGALCYRIAAGDAQIAIVTDLGCMPAELLDSLRGCQYYIFEANHDEMMERQSGRPWSLKQRVLGKYGHLSNEQAAQALAELAGEARGIWLAHLSEECNFPDLATRVVAERLRQVGISAPVHHLPAREVSQVFGVTVPIETKQIKLMVEEN